MILINVKNIIFPEIIIFLLLSVFEVRKTLKMFKSGGKCQISHIIFLSNNQIWIPLPYFFSPGCMNFEIFRKFPLNSII